MTHMDGTCLGAQSDTKECIKAQELNLQMQAYLVVLGDILAQMGPINQEYKEEIVNQQHTVDKYVRMLKKQSMELNSTLTIAKNSTNVIGNSKILLRQHQYEYVGWSIGTIIIAILIYRQMMRK